MAPPRSDSDDPETDSISESEDNSLEEDLRSEIAEIPFEELQKARCDGRSAVYAFKEQKTLPKRANKNRPTEVSSKKPVGRFRQVIEVPKRVIRDPRFESICGSYEESKFKKSYNFLYDEELPAERKRLQKLLDKDQSHGASEEIKKYLRWIDTQLKEEQQRRKRCQRALEQRKREKEAVAEGKKPFYLKKSAIRKQELVEKYKDLKASGKLDAFVAKRRRKNAAKDHRYIPYRRPAAV